MDVGTLRTDYPTFTLIMNTIIKVGDKAPEFSLFDSDKKKQSLSDYRGSNVLLLFSH